MNFTNTVTLIKGLINRFLKSTNVPVFRDQIMIFIKKRTLHMAKAFINKYDPFSPRSPTHAISDMPAHIFNTLCRPICKTILANVHAFWAISLVPGYYHNHKLSHAPQRRAEGAMNLYNFTILSPRYARILYTARSRRVKLSRGKTKNPPNGAGFRLGLVE